MKKRCSKLYKLVAEAAAYKLEVHESKGDWRSRDDKTQERLLSGLICEVGELCSAQLDKRNIGALYRECGDILNYLIIILDKYLLAHGVDIVGEDIEKLSEVLNERNAGK